MEKIAWNSPQAGDTDCHCLIRGMRGDDSRTHCRCDVGKSHDLSTIYAIEAYLQICVPLAFVISVMRRRLVRTRIVGLILHLRGPARLSSVTGALQSVFEDPDLEIVDGSAALRRAAADHDRICLPIRSSSGEQLAVVMADRSLSPNDDLVRAALAASSFALENAQLEKALRAQLQEVHESRLRIIEAGVTERRRLERDLHDGTQQRLGSSAVSSHRGRHRGRCYPGRDGRVRNELAAISTSSGTSPTEYTRPFSARSDWPRPCSRWRIATPRRYR